MTKWNCNFQIPDSAVQLAEVDVVASDVVHANGQTTATITLVDYMGNEVKTFEHTVEGTATAKEVETAFVQSK